MLKKNRKISIVFLVNSGGFSGAERVNLKIIDSLRNKYKFYYASEEGPIDSYLAENNIEHILIDKISVKTIRQIENKYHPNIFHATDYNASVMCALAHIKTPFISHLHCNSLWLKKVHPYVFAYLYAARKAAKILTVSQSVEGDYIFSKFIKGKMQYVSNPICCEDILMNCNRNQKKEYDICFTGRITEQKNPFLFLKIVRILKKKFPNLKALMIGDGDLKDSVVEKIKEYKMSDCITLTGFQKNPYQFMEKAKIFLLPSRYEGYPLVAIEALALGMPCVIADVGGCGTIVTDKCGFLCKTTSDYINGLTKLLDDEKTYEKYSSEAKKRAAQLENSKKYMQTIDSCYEKISKRKK